MKIKPILMALAVLMSAGSMSAAYAKPIKPATTQGGVGGKSKPNGVVNGTTNKPIKHH